MSLIIMTLSTTAVIFKCLLDLNVSKNACFAKNRDLLCWKLCSLCLNFKNSSYHSFLLASLLEAFETWHFYKSVYKKHTLLKHANSNRLVSSRHAKLSSNKIVRHLIITTLNSECSAWSWYDVNGAARMLTNSNFY